MTARAEPDPGCAIPRRGWPEKVYLHNTEPLGRPISGPVFGQEQGSAPPSEQPGTLISHQAKPRATASTNSLRRPGAEKNP